jgi:ATP-dependent Zn protease
VSAARKARRMAEQRGRLPKPSGSESEAFHEAGHAVVAAVLGRRFAYVSLEKEAVPATQSGRPVTVILTAGCMDHPEDVAERKRQIERGEIDHAWIVRCMAGYASEKLAGQADGAARRAAETDLASAHEMLKAGGVSGDDANRRIGEAGAEAVRILGDHWHAVHDVVRALLDLGRLSEAEVKTIVLAAEAKPPA